MFDHITRTAGDIATDAATNATKLTNNIATTAKTAAAKVSDVNVDLTGFDLSKLGRFDPRNYLGALELPTFDVPEFDLPDVDVPAEIDRVADVVRDIAYAGLGAVVITAQQVDANVRRLTSRAA